MIENIFATKISILAGVLGAITLFLTTVGLLSNPTPIVSTENGQVQGRVDYSRNGTRYLSYLGIPYAEPPIGDLRFEATKPLNATWAGVKEVTRYSPRCLQLDIMVSGRILGEEDCLYLNVFTNGTEGKRPVMIYIYGGGFLAGASIIYQPDFFMDHANEIVLVTFDYRVGPLGFMNTGDGLISGNMGLKDQVMALKWVQNNIAKFGGDPNKVTLFGESAGAVSVEYHTVSPLSKGLFHRAILQSGGLGSPWSFLENPGQVAFEYLEMLEDCPLDNREELLNCMKIMNAEKLLKLQWNVVKPIGGLLMFAPSAELESDKNAFITEHPIKLLKAGKVVNKVPALYGVLSGEGALITAKLDSVPEVMGEIDENWEALVPRMLLYDRHDGRNEFMAGAIRDLYFGDNSFTEDIHEFKKNFSKLNSDAFFFEPVHRSAKLHAEQGQPTYLYYYDYDSLLLPNMYSILRAVREDDWILSEIKIAYVAVVDWIKENVLVLEGPHEFGETHANDILLLWNMEGFSAVLAGPDQDFSAKFVKSFVDFARNEEPFKFGNIPWPPIPVTKVEQESTIWAPSQFPYMLLGAEPRVISEPFADIIPFWESLRDRGFEKLEI